MAGCVTYLSNRSPGHGVKVLTVTPDAAGVATAYYRSGGAPSPKSYGYPVALPVYVLPDVGMESYEERGSGRRSRFSTADGSRGWFCGGGGFAAAGSFVLFAREADRQGRWG